MSQSPTKATTKSDQDGHVYTTLGSRSIGGQPYQAGINAVILAYLALEGPRDIEEVARMFFSASSTRGVTEFQKYLDHLRKQLGERGAEARIVQRNAQVGVENLVTDYEQLLAACERRDIAAAERLAKGEFLAGLASKLKSREVTQWIGHKEAIRREAIWEAYLHAAALGRIPAEKLRTAYARTRRLPDATDIRFIYLYDLLSAHHTGDDIKRDMQAAVREQGGGTAPQLSQFIETRREALRSRNAWKSPLELWGPGPPAELPAQEVEARATPALNEDEEREGPRQRRSWIWTAGLAALALGALWLLLWPLSAQLNAQGVASLAAERYSDALRHLRAGEALNRLGPRRAAVPYNLANALEALGRSDEAEAYYRRALELDSDFYAAYNNLARLLLREGRPLDALPLLERAYERTENRPDLAQAQAVILKNLAWTRYELGSFDAAQRDVERALAAAPALAALHCLAGLIAEARAAGAREHWERCVAYDAAGEAATEPAWRQLAQDRLASR